MIRICFTLTDGQPKLLTNGAGPGEYLAIGWHREGRRLLTDVASNALSDLESRGLVISEPDRKLITQMEAAQERKFENGFKAFAFDSSGPRTGTFRTTLRKYCNHMSVPTQNRTPVEPVMIYAAAVAKALEEEINAARVTSIMGHEAVGDKFIISTVTQRYGFTLYTDEHIKLINDLFGMTNYA